MGMSRREKLMSKPLGDVQRQWLVMLYERRSKMWYDGCGFVWDKVGRTTALCVSLADRGLMEDAGMVKGPFGDRQAWRLTAAGVAQAKKILEERNALNRQGTGQGE